GIELATWIEDGVRRLLRQAALGELGTDLSATADETLIATGLEAGDAEITVYAEDVPPVDEFRIVEAPEPEPAASAPFDRVEEIDELEGAVELGGEVEAEDHMDTRILEPIPGPGEITVTATHWLDEVDQETSSGHSLEWPAAEERDLQHRERIDTPRVRHLFPGPDSNWDLSPPEVEYR